MRRLLTLLLAAAAMTGCGANRGAPTPLPTTPPPAAHATVPPEPTAEAGFDIDDPALSTLPEDEAHTELLIKRVGDRSDFRVPPDAVTDLDDGPLVLTVVIRPFNELVGDEPAVRRLSPGQLAVFAMYVADSEILNGGFAQLYENSGGAIAGDLTAAAERVGAPEHAAIFRVAAALWPGGEIPRDRESRSRALAALPADKLAALDDRYAALQYRRETSLAVVLAPYIRAHTDQFVSG
jgi:hypothetical protein